MNEKTNDDGTPRVVWLQDVLDTELGPGACTVICPITDAFVGHHGALGGFVRVYCRDGLEVGRVLRAIEDVPGLERVLSREAVTREFELPSIRRGTWRCSETSAPSSGPARRTTT